MPKVLITTVPFSEKDSRPIELLKAMGIEFLINPLGRKLSEDELAGIVGDYDILIAGTEPITEKVINSASRLKLISRVGIGLDNVDLLASKKRGIAVSYTPDAPAPAVAELTIGLIFALMRSSHCANLEMHRGEWRRHFGRRINDISIGIIGFGRIGKQVFRYLEKLGFKNIMINDIDQNLNSISTNDGSSTFVDKETIYKHADVISLHLPLNLKTKNMIGRSQLMQMKSDAMIINTSRGGIINEVDLIEVLNTGHLSGAAIDVFECEPYSGGLSKIDRCLLTSHMGSMSVDCRTRMEIEATEEAVRFLMGKPLKGLVPVNEYEERQHGQ